MSIIDDHLNEVEWAMEKIDYKEVEKAIRAIKTVKSVGGTIWLAGNGGSAATASHMANDLTKMCGVKAISIPDMTPAVTAYGNDDGWTEMYAKALEAHMQDNDAVVAISCSGNSQNVISFLVAARRIFRIGLTGPDENNKMTIAQCDALIRAHAQDITVQEDIHSIVCHAIARSLRDG
jgi:D-sedoheptulose 7-phosphate isomerase